MLILTLADPRAGCVCVSERYIKHLNTLLSSLIPQPKDVESGLRGELRGGGVAENFAEGISTSALEQ